MKKFSASILFLLLPLFSFAKNEPKSQNFSSGYKIDESQKFKGSVTAENILGKTQPEEIARCLNARKNLLEEAKSWASQNCHMPEPTRPIAKYLLSRCGPLEKTGDPKGMGEISYERGTTKIQAICLQKKR